MTLLDRGLDHETGTASVRGRGAGPTAAWSRRPMPAPPQPLGGRAFNVGCPPAS